MTTQTRDATSLGASAPVMSPDLIRQVPDGVEARELSYQEAIREALREEMVRDERVFLMGEDIAQARRRLRGDPDAVRPVRWGARPQHADLGEHDRRGRDRRGARRDAPGDRDHVRRLRRPGDGPDRDPGRQDPVHDRRTVHRPVGAAHAAGRRRRQEHGGPAFAEPRGLVRPYPGPQGRAAVDPVRREGPHDGGDPRRQPRRVPRAQVAVLVPRPRADGRIRAAAESLRRQAQRHGRHRRRLGLHGLARDARGPDPRARRNQRRGRRRPHDLAARRGDDRRIRPQDRPGRRRRRGLQELRSGERVGDGRDGAGLRPAEGPDRSGGRT